MRCNVLKVVGLLNIVAAAVARGEVGAGAVPSSDQQYYQYLSLRYHTAANPSPPPPLQSPPWETLAVLAAGIKQLIPFPNPQEGVWALTADYTLYAVTVPPQQNQPRHSDGASTPTPTPTTSATSVELVNISISHGAVLTAAAAGEVGTPTTEMTLAVATPNAVTWYSVAKGAAVVKGHVLLTPTPLQTQMPTANLKSKPKNAISTVNAAACAPGLASSASVRTDRRLREAVGPRKGQPILPCHTVFVASDVGLFQASMGGGRDARINGRTGANQRHICRRQGTPSMHTHVPIVTHCWALLPAFSPITASCFIFRYNILYNIFYHLGQKVLSINYIILVIHSLWYYVYIF